MLVSEAITAIRSGTNHDADHQVEDVQLQVQIDLEQQRLRRALSEVCPSLYEVAIARTIAAGASTFAKPAGFDRIRKVERLISGTLYYPLRVADPLNCIATTNAPGDYRLTYLPIPTSVATGSTAVALDVPDGCAQIIVERASAWVRQRHDESPAYHENVAEGLWREMRSDLRKRYGVHPVGGLVRARDNWGLTFYEQGANIVVVA